MFVTLTIDTNQARRHRKLRFSKTKFNPARGWKKVLRSKKRTLVQKVKAFWDKPIKNGYYRMNEQVAMF